MVDTNRCLAWPPSHLSTPASSPTPHSPRTSSPSVPSWIGSPESGACLQAALNSLLGPPAPDDERAADQRRADALVELARQKLDAGGLPEVAGQRPHLSLLVRPAEGGAGELAWGGLMPAETVLRLACDSTP